MQQATPRELKRLLTNYKAYRRHHSGRIPGFGITGHEKDILDHYNNCGGFKETSTGKGDFGLETIEGKCYIGPSQGGKLIERIKSDLSKLPGEGGKIILYDKYCPAHPDDETDETDDESNEPDDESNEALVHSKNVRKEFEEFSLKIAVWGLWIAIIALVVSSCILLFGTDILGSLGCNPIPHATSQPMVYASEAGEMFSPKPPN